MCDPVILKQISIPALALLTAGSPAFSMEAEFVPSEIVVPEGFVVEIAAAPPHVGYPMMGCLDESGRLFVAESRGQNLDRELF